MRINFRKIDTCRNGTPISRTTIQIRSTPPPSQKRKLKNLIYFAGMRFAVREDGLTEREHKYVQARLLGMTPHQAAKHAGVKSPDAIEGSPKVYTAIQKGFEEARQRFQVSREEVVEGIKEGIDLARLTSDAGNVIKGWTEIARICGLIAPAKTEVAVSVDQPLLPSKLKELPTEQLLQLVGKRRELEILEAEFEEVMDDAGEDRELDNGEVSGLHPRTDSGDPADPDEGGADPVPGVQEVPESQ